MLCLYNNVIVSKLITCKLYIEHNEESIESELLAGYSNDITTFAF